MPFSLLALLLIFLTSCQNAPVWQYGMFKRPPGNNTYSDTYIKGWQDGCESGAQASANYLYRWKYKYKQDWQMLTNREYMSGWDAAYSHCRKYIHQHNMQYLN